ncbi:hypothetical protein NB701_002116 [Pantoea ananatis]|nr:hypothetical protein [Pantoea ananatis]
MFYIDTLDSFHFCLEREMKRLSALLTLKSLNGCAASPLSHLMMNQRYQTRSDIAASWVGASADDLIMSWGPPQSSQTPSHGSSIHAYLYRWLLKGSDLNPWDYISEYATCVQRFLVKNGLITRWYSSGDCPKRPEGAKLIPDTAIAKSTLTLSDDHIDTRSNDDARLT